MNLKQWQRNKKIKAEAEAAAKRTIERVLNAVKEPAMSEFKVGQILVKRNTFNQPSKSTSLWKVVYVYADAVEVVPLKDGKELKMLQGIYGSAMFNPASTEEIAAGHRIDKPSDSRELETLDKLENHISPLCKTIGDQS